MKLWQRLLEFAIEIGKDAVVETIWSTGFITPEFRSKSGRFFAPLHFASERNKPTIFRSILAKDNVDPNVLEMSKIVRSRGRLGPRETLFTEETPLICASGAGHLSIVKILLEHKDIDVNRSDYEGKTALIRAAENGKEDVVALLIKREDIVLDSRCKKNGNAFVYSAKHSQRVKSALAVMKLLHATGKLDIRSTIEGVSAVGWAAKEGNCEKLQFLFELGFDPDENEVETKGKTPLITATVHSATDVVQLLLSTGRVNVNGTDRTDHTALAHAIRSMGHRLCRRTECGLVEIVGILLSVHDIDINRKYRNSGQNVLALLCSKNHLMSFEIDHSDHVNHPSTRHFYSLKREKALWHQKNCDRLILELLLSQKLLEVDAEDNNGRTPLSLAAQMRGPNILEILIFEMLVSRGSTEVHFNSRDEKGRTPLSWAVETRYTSSASTLQSVQDQISPLQQLLQLQFVDPNLKDLSGKSPLLWAAEIFKPAAMVAFLCCEWVDIFVRDSNGDGLMEYLFKHRPVRIEVPLIQDLYELRKSRMATEPLRYEEYKQWLEENTGPVLGWTSEEHDLILGPLDWDGSGDEI
ncbi:ankyrin [Ascobolus immersus RN42]|uniref:Ankyrin n=1 Tax=Ascobolus immersus RN42 TaxID=1160509 RepID=A0A3N4HMW8_ASCIM|nr:ankyrin [Ascobolus immersus RN42]